MAEIVKTYLIDGYSVCDEFIGWFCTRIDAPWSVNDRVLWYMIKIHLTIDGRYVLEHNGATWGRTTTMQSGFFIIKDVNIIDMIKNNKIYKNENNDIK